MPVVLNADAQLYCGLMGVCLHWRMQGHGLVSQGLAIAIASLVAFMSVTNRCFFAIFAIFVAGLWPMNSKL